MPAIEVNSLVKKFGDFTAVDNISFKVEEGEIFAFLGPTAREKPPRLKSSPPCCILPPAK